MNRWIKSVSKLTLIFASCSILVSCHFSKEYINSNELTSAYRVKIKRGDTLPKLAARFGADWRAVAVANAIEDPDSLPIGKEIIIDPNARVLTSQNNAIEQEFIDITLQKNRKKFNLKRWPVAGPVTSRYGMRRGKMHKGIDIAAPTGRNIRAVDDGKVVFSGWQRGYGKVVIVKHDGYSTLYAHATKLKVKKGTYVPSGTPIATVGKTGNARGVHLHFEIRNSAGKAVRPSKYLPKRRTLISKGLSASLKL